MNELQEIEKKVEKEERLRQYTGVDRVIHAEEKLKEVNEEKTHRPAFNATTGLVGLDTTLGGLRKGQLIILSGAPKNGKTQMCQTFTDRFVKDGFKCLWFSYELGYEEFFEKFPMLVLDFYVPNYLSSGNVEWVEDKIIEAKMKHGLDFVFIDHLDFLRDPNVMKGVNYNMSSYVGGICQQVKRMAVKHDVVIFMMCHIRKNKWTSNDLPGAEELRDSGQIAQLADIVLMVSRKRVDGLYDGNKAVLGVIENRRNGKTQKFSVELRHGLFVETGEEAELEKQAESAARDYAIFDKPYKE